MTEPTNPIADDVSDSRPQFNAAMTLRRKLVLLAVPTILAVISVPVGIAHAHGTVQGHTAAANNAQAAVSVAVKQVHSAAPKATLKAAAAGEPAEAPEATTDPPETGTDTGHADETPGSTTESNVDHQFNGQE